MKYEAVQTYAEVCESVWLDPHRFGLINNDLLTATISGLP